MSKVRRILSVALLPLAVAATSVGAEGGERLAGPFVANVQKVIDGDTLSVEVPVWLGLALTASVRLRGIDAPELHGQCQREKDLAMAAQKQLAQETPSQVTLRNIEGDKYYGRVEANVTSAEGIDLGEAMLASGLARPYDGGKRGDWCGVASLGG